MTHTALRIRKAWFVSVPWSNDQDTRYGPTASKVRYDAWLDYRDQLPDLSLMQIRVIRAPGQDVQLPPEHPVVADLSPEERSIILHAFGANRCGNDFYRAGYRGHFVDRAGNADLCRLVERGLMAGPFGHEENAAFLLNWMGRRVAQSMLPVYAS